MSCRKDTTRTVRCNIGATGCDEMACDRMVFINPHMDWHGDTLGQGFACRAHALALIDPIHTQTPHD